MEKQIEVYNLGGLPVAPVDSFLELQEDFKRPDPEKIAKLQMLILTRGFKYSFKVWRDGDGRLWIIDAHQRKKALMGLRKYGYKIPPIPYEEIQAADKREAVEEIAAYNSEFAQKNPDTILFDKYKITAADLSIFNLGFEVNKTDFAVSTDRLFGQGDGDGVQVREDDVDNIPDASAGESSFVKTGDIWLLGDNRLMCGDSRSMQDVRLLMDGRQADLILTDPPYNVSYEGGGTDKLKIQNDSMEEDLFYRFLHTAFEVMYGVLKDGGSFYVFHADSEGERFRRALRECGFKIAQCCVWVKDTLVMGRQDYQWQHEPCLYGWKPTASHFWNADRRQTTVWRFDRPKSSKIHPTMKPVALMAYPICNSTRRGAVVADFFSGSGSTLMACQQTDRTARAMEISPQYVAVTVQRFRAMFPQLPVTLLRNGELLDADRTKMIIDGQSDE